MATTILHHNGAYNIFTSISDGMYWEEALTLDQLKEWYKEENGNQGLHELVGRLERAHKTGSSNRDGETIEDCYESCKYGCNGDTTNGLSYDEFILRYLTLVNK